MTNQPKGKQDTGDEKPAAEQHIALAIESFEKEYRSRQEQSAEHDRQTLKWAKRTAIGVAIYTVLTAAITVASIYSACISYRTMVNGQRAFVFPQQTQITGMQDGPNVRWYISPIWENVGNTPARRLIVDLGCIDAREEIDKPFDFEATSKSKGPRILGSHQTTVGGACERSAAQLAAIQRQSAQTYMWGTARYRDIFGDEHRTRFCISAQILSDPNVPTRTPSNLVSNCKWGNCDDSECDCQDAEAKQNQE
jgi:hypothetical protein